MKESFKEFELTDSETLWLKAVFNKNFEKFSIKDLKIELWDDLSNDFDPVDFDWRFYRSNRITLVGLWHIDPQNGLFNLCEKVIYQIEKEIRKHRDVEKVASSEIGNAIDASPKKVGIAFLLLSDLGFLQGGSWFDGLYSFKIGSLWNNEKAYDKFLGFENLDSEIEEFFIKHKPKSSFGIKNLNNGTAKNASYFVSPERIAELETLKADKFEFSRLIELCKELNSANQTNSYHSIALLSRALIDHIPPIFDCKNFTEVTNNYGSRSFKESMTHLNKSSRKIADAYLHTQIRKKESLPNFTQVNFSHSIDVLLAEIIRKCRENYT